MADEQVNEAKLSNSQSPRESSIRSRNDFEPITPVMPIEKVQSPKVQSPKTSTLRTSPVVTTPASSVKGSVQLSLKSQKSIKNESLEATQVENKSLKSLSLRKDLNDNREENVIGKEDFLSSPKVWNNNNNEIKKMQAEPTDNTEHLHNTPVYSNINKISNMSKILTDEANALRESIKSLSEGIVRTKQELKGQKEDINFPYHLFLIEIIINKINMKCECFELDYNNLVIAATFLGKPPITLYDSSYGKIDDFSDLNVGKSALFAMTYDKICSITDFIVNLSLTKQPPCSNCVSKIAETKIDYTNEFKELRDELCKKWTKEQPNDNIICTTSTPLNRNMYYLSCGVPSQRDVEEALLRRKKQELLEKYGCLDVKMEES
ncbi:putative actin-fragmin kinase DDB_G0287957 isoform X1 [Vanessa atalanta]|uniref:putative actin-fragmin kinase DDB_G0287957 isoform X1 n=1 Tax=Vanessa atalanta TaxID=42275 RepID=UPI001FCD0DEA|nr:putative actin-fragmin kinase DDB_G0287957 isoform X1 [Vanessa atalanta]